MSTDDDRAPTPPDRTRPTRRVWTTFALFTVVLVVAATSAGYGIGALLPTRYAAHADVLYALTREQPTGFLREDRNLSTQLVLLTSRTVLGPVASQTGVPVEDLAEALTTTVVEESEVIQIEFRDTDPEVATRILDAIVTQYLAVSNNDARADVRGYIEGQLTEVLDRIAQARTDADRQDELAPLVAREQQLRTQLDEIALSDLAGPGARVLVPPYAEVDPVSTGPLVTAATGGLTALLVAALALAVMVRRQIRR
ncbi:hypothetical protein ACFFTK_26755 [Pseudonocardia petroleophila]|uniref:Chain length determinant protein n=1 Tax=Pseudonocardia petroleophila TaxID=37331 RepID=A0A7G7MQE8_9PSEU|nr:hypothetical protein [Pseudonocardia petroleophila]QNG55009.1 hypothetical protein H6H00_14725 [Pseudonocardia petroleophila]